MRSASLRVLAFLGLAFFAAAPREALAASVFVQWATDSSAGAIVDPTFATHTEPESFTEAALTPGTFKTFASATGAPGIVDGTSSYAGVDSLNFMNAGAGAVCFGGAPGACPTPLPFDIALHATFAHTASPPDLNQYGWDQFLIATFRVTIVGELDRVAQVAMQAGELWNGGVVTSSLFTVVPLEQNGATVTLTTATPGLLEATLSMPMIELDPGESMRVDFILQTVAGAQSSPNFSSIVDASAQLRLVLPAGASLTNDATVPLQWVTVPEPTSAALLVTGALGLVACRRRRRLRA